MSGPVRVVVQPGRLAGADHTRTEATRPSQEKDGGHIHMRYELLGPLRVVDGGASSFISARKIEMVFTALLVRADHVVTRDQLIVEVWGDRPPRRATAGLHVYISELRKFLSRDPFEDRILTRPSGYLLDKGRDQIDVDDFLELVRIGRGHAQSHDLEAAADAYERGLALWRGTVLGDPSPGPIVDSFATWITESRTDCIELLNDVQLQLGRHRELVGRLFSLIAEYPLRETFYRQLMLALYRSERKAEALRVYQGARTILRGELGLEPCRGLQEIQRAILVADDRALLDIGAAA
jgi:SARP family transcriptional regulator, regulator of embCAB operon